MLILNTTQHQSTALVVAPFGDDGAMHFTPLRGDKPGDSFILDAIAVRELAAFVTPEVDDHA